MGTTHVTVKITNPAQPKDCYESLFLVDTGAIDSVVPRSSLMKLGLVPEGTRTYELADGSRVQMDITIAKVEFMGEVVGQTIVFGEDGIEPILGVTALESVGIGVDPQNQSLKRMPTVRLKKMIPMTNKELEE